MLFRKTIIGTLTVFSSLITANVYASSNGPYLGFQFGWGNVHQATISRADMVALMNDIVFPDSFTLHSFKNSNTTDGWAGRVYTGWQFNCHWALEAGYTRFHTFEANASIFTTDNVTGDVNNIATALSGHTQAFDLVAKLMLPYCEKWNFYAKFGAAYLWNNLDASIVINGVTATDEELIFVAFSDNQSRTLHKVFPTFGLGVSYDYNPQLVMDLSWNHIQRTNGDSNFGSTDLVAIGAAWHFNC